MKPHFVLSLTVAAAAAVQLHAGDLTAHEWGTFTSVQGSDGNVLSWNPLASSELPKFVHNRIKPLGGQGSDLVSVDDLKAVHQWTQRLETPVVYFYSDSPMKVSFEARFPSGLITEWYPQLNAFGPNRDLTNYIPVSTVSFARWDSLELLPADKPEAKTALPTDSSANHYYVARETAASTLQSDSKLSRGTKPEVEKFIFYRGAGNFPAPLKVSLADDSSVQLQNLDSQPLHDLWVLNIKDQHAKFTAVNDLEPGTSHTVDFQIDADLKPIGPVMDQLRDQMEASLVHAGLFRDEAKAMVKTWSDSWFAENGVRVLYLLPREWTDNTIPVTITPTPAQLVRVMVGRADVLSHATEQKLEEIYTTSRNPESIPAAIDMLNGLHLGRFTQAALTRMEIIEHDRASVRIRELRANLNARHLARK